MAATTNEPFKMHLKHAHVPASSPCLPPLSGSSSFNPNVATLALGSRPRQKGLQGCGPKGSLGVTSETLGSARECEGVSLHTPKATPTLGEGVPVDSRNFKERFEGSNLNGSWRSLYHWKALGTYMSKMGSHCSFGHLKHKLRPKEGPGVKTGSQIANLTPDH